MTKQLLYSTTVIGTVRYITHIVTMNSLNCRFQVASLPAIVISGGLVDSIVS